jgi:hypothetical protein
MADSVQITLPLQITVRLGDPAPVAVAPPAEPARAAPAPGSLPPGEPPPVAAPPRGAAGSLEDQLVALLRANSPALTETLAEADPAVVERAVQRYAAEVAPPEEEGVAELFRPAPADPAGEGLQREWEDWLGQNGVAKLDRAVRVDSVAAVCRVVREARANGRRLKATASRHADNSLSRPDQVRIDVRGIAGELPKGKLKPGVDARHLVRVGAGTLIRELNELLAKKKLALVNMGAYDGQHIIGAIATGTHGSGGTLGPLADAVEAIEIVLEDGLVHRFEPAPGLAAEFPDGTLHVGPDFYGMVVGLGGVGVVVALTLRVRDAYRLCERREIATWSVTRNRLRTRLAMFRHYEVLLNPYLTGPSSWRPQAHPGDDRTTVETMRWEATSEAGNPVPDEPQDPDARVPADQGTRNPLIRLSNALPAKAVSALMNLSPNAIPGLMDTALRALEVPYQGKGVFYVDQSDKVLLLGVGTKAHGFEIAVPLDRVEDAVDAIVETLDHFATTEHGPSRAFVTSPFSLRFVKGTPHWLAATHADDRDGKPVAVWVTIEMPRLLGTRNAGFVVGEVERRLKKLGGRPHWGQHNALAAADAALFPRWQDWQALAARHDPSRTFANNFLVRMGLVPGEILEGVSSGANVVHLEGEGFLAETGASTSAETRLRALFDTLADQDELLLYAHGALVSEKEGQASAASLGGQIASTSNVTPLCLVWETGPLELLAPTLRDLLCQTDLGRRLVWWVVRTLDRAFFPGLEELLRSLDIEEAAAGAVPGGWIGPADAAIPESALAAEVLARLSEDATLATTIAAIARVRQSGDGVESLADTDLRLAHAFLDEVTGGVGLESAATLLGFAHVVARVALAVVKRKRAPLGWTNARDVVVEEVARAIGGGTVGQALWARTKRNAAGAYQPNRGGDVLVGLLTTWLRQRPGRKLHLAAHCAGAFHVGAIVAALDRRIPGPTRLIETLTLWAPACDHTFLHRQIGQARSRIGDTRLFALTAATEDSDALIPLLYGGSLLDLASGLFEAEPGWPIAGLVRFLDGAAGVDADAVRALLDRRTVRAPTPADAPAGARSGATGHAAFTGDEQTRESLVTRIRGGSARPAP